ncbi:MAG: hypothetical protein WCT18_04425 [Patescibacteria group bacterium]
MIKKKFQILFLLVALFFFSANNVLAADAFGEVVKNAQNVGKAAGVENSASLPDIIAKGIKFIMAICGTALIVLIVYAGFLWMTAGGGVENIEKAKKLLKNGMIGLLLIVAGYSITDFVVQNLVNLVSNSQ